MQSHIKNLLLLPIVLGFMVSCSSSQKFWESEKKTENQEFDKLVKVEEVIVQEIDPNLTLSNDKVLKKKVIKKKIIKNKKTKSIVSKKTKTKNTTKIKIQKNTERAVVMKEKETPKVEPTKSKPKEVVKKDVLANSPFVVGEKTKIEVSYLNMTAGHLYLETIGLAKVNGRLSYHFRGTIKSRKLFSFVYSVDDVANTYVDVESLRPYSLEFKVKESKKIKDSKTYFDWNKMTATYWSRKVKKGRKPKEVKTTWKILPGSQNFVSALFYLRTIDYSKVKKFSFPLADEGKSIILKGKVIRKETLKTDIGKLDTWVVEPEFQIDGSLAPVGKIYFWFTADKKQRLVKIDTKLKFGSIVGEVVSN